MSDTPYDAGAAVSRRRQFVSERITPTAGVVRVTALEGQ
jgi:hypothetical protein